MNRPPADPFRRRDPLYERIERHEPRDAPERPLRHRLALIVAAVAAMTGAGVIIQRTVQSRLSEGPRIPEAMPAAAGDPIAGEAEVFRMRPGMEAVAPDARRRNAAHPRSLASYRALRSYPGAPPRIPHGLTAAEFRGTRCNTCHERGGFSQRFASYAPVNPHPEQRMCLQCHAPSDQLVGVSFPQSGPNDVCRQCHAGVPAKFSEATIDWRPAAWPALSDRGSGAVPVIPHDLASRGNCLACHMGPGAVAEVRTSHPERAACRQCHAMAGQDAGTFVRPPPLPGAFSGVQP